MYNNIINRRHFLKTASASFALAALGASGLNIIHHIKTVRVGLIGTGWYGKSDLFRLIQVSPVEVLGLCDVDNNKLKEAGIMVGQRQKSGKEPRLYKDYGKMVADNTFHIVIIRTPGH